MSRILDISSVIILSTAQWASRTQQLSKTELGINTDNGEVRVGPGTWDQCGPASARKTIDVVAVTTTNITIASALVPGETHDGVVLAEGDAVLVAGNNTASQNGVIIVSASPARAAGITFNDLATGLIRVARGTVGAGKLYRSTAAAGGTLGSTALPFSAVKPGPVTVTGKHQLAGLNVSPTLNDNMLVAVEDPNTGLLVKTTIGALKTHIG